MRRTEAAPYGDEVFKEGAPAGRRPFIGQLHALVANEQARGARPTQINAIPYAGER